MKKIVYAFNIISALPSMLVVPLLPFVFILVQGEGRVPGYFHESAVKILMFVYPLLLIGCVIASIKLTRKDRPKPALPISLLPLVAFALLFFAFYFGGVQLR